MILSYTLILSLSLQTRQLMTPQIRSHIYRIFILKTDSEASF